MCRAKGDQLWRRLAAVQNPEDDAWECSFGLVVMARTGLECGLASNAPIAKFIHCCFWLQCLWKSGKYAVAMQDGCFVLDMLRDPEADLQGQERDVLLLHVWTEAAVLSEVSGSHRSTVSPLYE